MSETRISVRSLFSPPAHRNNSRQGSAAKSPPTLAAGGHSPQVYPMPANGGSISRPPSAEEARLRFQNSSKLKVSQGTDPVGGRTLKSRNGSATSVATGGGGGSSTLQVPGLTPMSNGEAGGAGRDPGDRRRGSNNDNGKKCLPKIIVPNSVQVALIKKPPGTPKEHKKTHGYSSKTCMYF